MRKTVIGLCCLTFVMACALQSADARPKYYSTFKKVYPDVEGLGESKCYTCHIDKKKKKVNDYGKAMATSLGEDVKNIKDVEAIKKALEATEKLESKIDGKSYGELLKDNKLPSNEKKEESEKS